jgi:hypothetical protein
MVGLSANYLPLSTVKVFSCEFKGMSLALMARPKTADLQDTLPNNAKRLLRYTNVTMASM